MWQIGICMILVIAICQGRTIKRDAVLTEISTTNNYESSKNTETEEEELVWTTTEQFAPVTHLFPEPTHISTPFPHSAEEENVKIGEDKIPMGIKSSFSCEGRVYGYYADPENECKVYHVCSNITMATGYTQLHRASFNCAPGTVFSQMHRTCVHPPAALPIDCKLAPQFYSINLDFGFIPPEIVEIPLQAQLNTIPIPGPFRPVINKITAPIREFMPFIPELKSAHAKPQPATNHPVSDVQSFTADDQAILGEY